jgi:hypothetical protein
VDGTPHDVPTPNRSISDLYKACRKSAEKYRRSRINREACLFQTLGRALELCRLSEATPEAGAELKQLMNDDGIRKTKRTANHFTPIVKLIFEGEVIEEEKSLVMRCASILRLADSRNIEPDGIAIFIDGQGGMVQCYKNDRAAHPSATATCTKPNPIRSKPYVRMLESAIRRLYGSLCPTDLLLRSSKWTRLAIFYCWGHGLLPHLKSGVTRLRPSRLPLTTLQRIPPISRSQQQLSMLETHLRYVVQSIVIKGSGERCST